MKKYKICGEFGKGKYHINSEFGNKVPIDTVEKVMKERVVLDIIKDVIGNKIKFTFEEVK